ncbi:MAG: TIGR04149 family rSAM-modified RiPP [Lachnospiraceae bacterium]|nr:TIGR04149 family rSAM-modified RiPP [Lachnospiraceae bacterium]
MKIKRFKLNSLSCEILQQKEMNSVVGGSICGCGCPYPSVSTTDANKSANFAGGYFSDINYWLCDDDGYWEEVPGMPRDTDDD